MRFQSNGSLFNVFKAIKKLLNSFDNQALPVSVEFSHIRPCRLNLPQLTSSREPQSQSLEVCHERFLLEILWMSVFGIGTWPLTRICRSETISGIQPRSVPAFMSKLNIYMSSRVSAKRLRIDRVTEAVCSISDSIPSTDPLFAAGRTGVEEKLWLTKSQN